MKVRRLATAVVCAAMMALVSGCGRQVTGLSQPGGGGALVPAGQMSLRFALNGQFNPGTYSYYIIFNTTGQNLQPYYLGTNSNFVNWSFAFELGGVQGITSKPPLYQFYQDPRAQNGVQVFPVPYPDSALTFQTGVPNTNAPNGFTLTFNRCILDVPPPNASGTGPTPAPSTHPSGSKCPPYFYLGNVWNITILTVDKNGFPIDGLGPQGAQDASFKYSVDTSAVVDNNYIRPAGSATTVTNDPSAQIYGLETLNSP